MTVLYYHIPLRSLAMMRSNIIHLQTPANYPIYTRGGWLWAVSPLTRSGPRGSSRNGIVLGHWSISFCYAAIRISMGI